MSGLSNIEWCDATWNPVRGCSRVSEGCRNCYAEAVAARFSGPGAPFDGFAEIKRDALDPKISHGPRWTGRVELVPSALDWPLRWRGAAQARAEGRPSRVFVNSMSDLFHERLGDLDIATVFGVMALAPQHNFLVLTKRPERMLDWFARIEEEYLPNSLSASGGRVIADTQECQAAIACRDIAQSRLERARTIPRRWVPWPLPNVWLGVSVEDQATADQRIPRLLRAPAAVRFVSYEPALGPVDFTQVLGLHELLRHGLASSSPLASISGDFSGLLPWVIVGGESGPGARPFDLAWARAAVKQLRRIHIACFVKQLGENCHDSDGGEVLGAAVPFEDVDGLYRKLRNRKGGDPSEWPEDLRVREFPKVAA